MIAPLDLDDLRYSALVAEARSLIPALCPTWTDQNPSDPGITMIELLAWLSEMVTYRINQVPDSSYRSFLTLLDPSTDSSLPLDDAIRQTVNLLRDPERAVTVADFSDLVLRRWPATAPASQVAAQLAVKLARPGLAAADLVKRVRCRIDQKPDGTPAPGHMSTVVIPGPVVSDQGLSSYPPPDQSVLDSIAAYLDQRRLLTAKLHVVGPKTTRVAISGSVYLAAGASVARLTAASLKAVGDFLDPLGGGPAREGWPFDRSLFASDIFTLLSGLPGVAFVESIQLSVGNVAQPNGVSTVHSDVLALDQLSLTFWQPAGTLWQKTS
jgi:hypothetical protein